MNGQWQAGLSILSIFNIKDINCTIASFSESSEMGKTEVNQAFS